MENTLVHHLLYQLKFNTHTNYFFVFILKEKSMHLCVCVLCIYIYIFQNTQYSVCIYFFQYWALSKQALSPNNAQLVSCITFGILYFMSKYLISNIYVYVHIYTYIYVGQMFDI